MLIASPGAERSGAEKIGRGLKCFCKARTIMSPTSVCFAVTKTEAGNLADANSMQSSKLPPIGIQFGIHRRPQDSSNPKASTTAQCLKVSKESHRIRKPPLPLPQVQYRPPVIIHTYSPKVIHTQPDDFMSLVQKLTGSSDTRLRLKRSPGSSRKKQLDKKDNKSKNGSTDIIDDDEETVVNNNSNNDANLSTSGFTEDPEHQGLSAPLILSQLLFSSNSFKLNVTCMCHHHCCQHFGDHRVWMSGLGSIRLCVLL